MKKIIITAICFIATILCSNSAFANQNTTSTREELVELIKISKFNERDVLIEELLSEKPLEIDEEDRNSESVETFYIDEKTSIDFLPNGDFALKQMIDTGIKPVIEEDDRNVSSMKCTNIYHNEVTLRNVFGGTIVHTWLDSYFRYDVYAGAEPVGYIESSGYNKGFLIMWEVYDWNEKEYYDYRQERAVCKVSAYYNWGIGVEGGGSTSGGASGSVSGGVTLQDYNLDLRLSCSKNGRVYKY